MKRKQAVLVAACIGHIFSAMGHSFMLAPFNAAIQDDLGLSEAWLSSIWALALLLAAVWANVAGRLLDTCGPRRIALYAALVNGLGLVVLHYSQTAFVVGAAYLLIRLSSADTAEFAFTHAVKQHWPEERGFALGLLGSVGSLEYALPAVVALLINAVGWQSTALTLAFACTGVLVVAGGVLYPPVACAPSGAALPGEPEESDEESEDGVSTEGSGLDPVAPPRAYSLSEAMKTSTLWAMLSCRVLVGLPWAGMNFFMVNLLTSSGNSPTDVVYVSCAMTVSAVLTPPFFGFLYDAIPSRMKHYGMTLMNWMGIVALLLAAAMYQLPPKLGPKLFGAALGAWSASFVVNSAALAHVFGTESMGAIAGLSKSVRVASSAAGPALFAFASEVGLEVWALLLILSACQLVGMVLVLLAPLPQEPIRPAPCKDFC